MDLDTVLTTAAKKNRLGTFQRSFICARTQHESGFSVTGVGLAQVEHGAKNAAHYECIILMDNGQLLYYRKDLSSGVGSYAVTETLEEIRKHDPLIGLVEKAYDTIDWYPL